MIPSERTGIRTVSGEVPVSEFIFETGRLATGEHAHSRKDVDSGSSFAGRARLKSMSTDVVCAGSKQKRGQSAFVGHKLWYING